MVGRLLLMLVDGSAKGSRCFERNLVVDDLVCESEVVVWRRKKREDEELYRYGKHWNASGLNNNE